MTLLSLLAQLILILLIGKIHSITSLLPFNTIADLPNILGTGESACIKTASKVGYEITYIMVYFSKFCIQVCPLSQCHRDNFLCRTKRNRVIDVKDIKKVLSSFPDRKGAPRLKNFSFASE